MAQKFPKFLFAKRVNDGDAMWFQTNDDPATLLDGTTAKVQIARYQLIEVGTAESSVKTTMAKVK